MSHTVPSFIRQVYIQEIGDIAKEQHYLSIMLMMMGIEFLGQCADPNKPFEYYAEGYGKCRFNDATQRLFPAKHFQISHRLDFYSRLRNGFAHKMRPASPRPDGATTQTPKDIYLIGPTNEWPHLYEDDYCVVIRSDGLYEHFKDACEKCINFIEDGTYTKIDFDLKSSEFLSVTPAVLTSASNGSLGHSLSATGSLATPSLSS
jgi:hypothetical protein